jgi:hypothetical protein
MSEPTGTVQRLSAKELADPEYMQAYVDECFRTVDALIAERDALAAQAVALAKGYMQLEEQRTSLWFLNQIPLYRQAQALLDAQGRKG